MTSTAALVLGLAVHTLAAFGFAFVVGFSKVLEPFRRVLEPKGDLVDQIAAWHHLTVAELLEKSPEQQRALADKAIAASPDITDTVVLNALRRWLYTLATCPPCVGFWTGLGAGVAVGLTTAPQHLPGWSWTLACATGGAFYTCASNLILGRAVGLISGADAP